MTDVNALFPASDIKTIAFDFDGVLATNLWPSPNIGEPVTAAIELAKNYFDHGYEVVVYTARPESHRGGLFTWLNANGMGFVYDVICNKPRAALYIDDKAAKWPEDFKEVQGVVV